MSEEVIAILSGLLGEKGEIKTAYQPIGKIVRSQKELKPVKESDYTDLMANWKPVIVKKEPPAPKYIPLHKKVEVRIPNLISRSPFIPRDIEMKE